jgi:hypothetical protein
LKKVFLGGTCNESTRRKELIPKLKIDYFNPVVNNWDEKAQIEELLQRATCDYCLYVITPKMTGVYSIAEVVDDSNKVPEKTVFCFLVEDGDQAFTDSQLKSLSCVGRMVQRNGAHWFYSLDAVACFLNATSYGEVTGCLNEHRSKRG